MYRIHHFHERRQILVSQYEYLLYQVLAYHMYRNRNRIFPTQYVNDYVFLEHDGLSQSHVLHDEVHVILLLKLFPFLDVRLLHHQMFQYLIHRCVFLLPIRSHSVFARLVLQIFLALDVKSYLMPLLFGCRFVYLFPNSLQSSDLQWLVLEYQFLRKYL